MFKHNIWLYVLVIILLLSSALFLAILTFDDEIEQIAKEQVSDYFSSKVEIGNIHLSPFRSFPKISIAISNVVIYEDPSFGNDILAKVDEVYLAMNFFSFFKKEFIIDRIIAEDGIVNIKQDANGNVNYLVFKDDSTSDSKKIQLDLKRISFYDVAFNYMDKSSQVLVSGKANEIELKGRFSNEKFNLSMTAGLYANLIEIDSIKYLTNTEIDIESEINANTINQLYTIVSSSVTMDEVTYSLSGKVEDLDNGKYLMNLSVKSTDIRLNEIVSLMPDVLKDTLKNYDLDGLFIFNGKIKGVYSSESTPDLNISFSLKDGKALNKINNSSLESISVKGNVSYTGNSGKYIIKLQEFKAKSDNRVLSLKANFTNLPIPFLSLTVQSNLKSEFIAAFLGQEKQFNVNGDIDLNLEIQLNTDDLVNNIYNKIDINGETVFRKLNLKVKEYDYNLTNLNGKLNFKDSIIDYSNLSGNISGSDFIFNGMTINVIPYVFDTNYQALVSGTIQSKYIRLDDFLLSDSSTSGESSYIRANELLFPGKLSYQVVLDCKKVTYINLKTEKLSGKIVRNGDEIILSRVNAQCSGGKINLSGWISKVNQNDFSFDANTYFQKVNVKEFFKQIDNFDQDYITDKHLSGLLSGNAQLSSQWHYDFTPNYDKLFVIGDILVEKGNLQDFQPIIDMMGFVKMKKMKSIYFDKLENTILIKDQVITIPNMEIKNSAFNISLSGTHSFKNEIDYHFKINLTEVFFKSKTQRIDEFQTAEFDSKGGIVIYAKMIGTVDDYKLQMDKKSAKESFKEDVKAEKQEFIKAIKNKNTIEEENFEFEWDDER